MGDGGRGQETGLGDGWGESRDLVHMLLWGGGEKSWKCIRTSGHTTAHNGLKEVVQGRAAGSGKEGRNFTAEGMQVRNLLHYIMVLMSDKDVVEIEVFMEGKEGKRWRIS